MKAKIVWENISSEDGKKLRDFLDECEKAGKRFISEKNSIAITKIVNSVPLENRDINSLNFLLERLIKNKMNPPIPISIIHLIGEKEKIQEIHRIALELNLKDY